MNNQEIFTSEEQNENEKRKRELTDLITSRENEERKRELIELVASGEAVLIVGAGSSARVGYVTWKGLLEKLEDLANKCGEGLDQRRKGDELAYAEDIKSHIEKTADIGKYYDLLDELFRPNDQGYNEFHKMLVDLPFRGILTTNYDTVLEAALLGKKIEAERERRQIRPIDVMPLVIGPDTPRLIHEFLLARSNDPHIPQRIAHLHGLHRYRESIILSSEDYVENYGLRVKKNGEDQNGEDQGNENRWTFHRKLLWAVLATRRAVFVGFSMEDIYFTKMLEIVSTDLWGWNKSIHFAIMGISAGDIKDSRDKADTLKNEYGIDTVFYEVLEDEISEKKHKLLEPLFADIVKQCENKGRSIGEAQDRPDDTDRPKGEEPRSVTSGSRDIFDWVKQATQRMVRRIGDED